MCLAIGETKDSNRQKFDSNHSIFYFSDTQHGNFKDKKCPPNVSHFLGETKPFHSFENNEEACN